MLHLNMTFSIKVVNASDVALWLKLKFNAQAKPKSSVREILLRMTIYSGISLLFFH